MEKIGVTLLTITFLFWSEFPDFNEWGSIASLFGLVLTILVLVRIQSINQFGSNVIRRVLIRQEDRAFHRTLWLIDEFIKTARSRQWNHAFSFGSEFSNHISQLSESTRYKEADIQIVQSARQLNQMLDDIRNNRRTAGFSLSKDQFEHLQVLRNWISSQDEKALVEALEEEVHG